MSDELDLQVENKLEDKNPPNPDGKGGFADHPENRNLNGRPAKGSAWSEILEELGERFVIDDKGKPTDKTFKMAVGEMLWNKCLGGDINAIKELFNRMEGLPRMQMEVKGKMDEYTPELIKRVDILLGMKIIDDGNGNNETTSTGNSEGNNSGAVQD